VNPRVLRALEVAAVLALLVAQFVVIASTDGSDPPVDAWTYLGGALVVLPVLWHRRAPLVVTLITLAGVGVVRWRGQDVELAVAVCAAPLLVALMSPPRWRGAAVLVAASLTLVALPAAGNREPNAGILLVIVPFVLLLARDLRRRLLRAGAASRRADEIEYERRLGRDAAIAAARAKVARDVHDIVAHSMSVIAARAAIGRQLAPSDPAFGRETLRLLSELTDESLRELDALVAALGGRDELATPDAEERDLLVVRLDQLGQLVDATRDAGHRVAVTVDGDLSDLAPSVSMTAYRIVQEALTNARRHAPGSDIAIGVTVADGRLGLRVVNGPATVDRPPPDSSGFGLQGVRERVALFDGHVDASADAAGGFALAVDLPAGAG
jgi:signal transduction histidine kinase